jgi:hypothetical protein
MKKLMFAVAMVFAFGAQPTVAVDKAKVAEKVHQLSAKACGNHAKMGKVVAKLKAGKDLNDEDNATLGIFDDLLSIPTQLIGGLLGGLSGGGAPAK